MYLGGLNAAVEEIQMENIEIEVVAKLPGSGLVVQ